MRILFSTPSPSGYMRPPTLGDEQVNCGPAQTAATDVDGRVVSLPTPVGEYDLAAVVAALPAAQVPDLVVCLVDSSRRNMPRNLGAFRCPRVLLVADTHHLAEPLQGLLAYAAGEPFDRIVLLYDRHHVGFFRSAGLRNLYWFPGLTFPHTDVAVREARQTSRIAEVAFVGQTGRFHPRRQRLVGALAERGLPLVSRAVTQEDALGVYGSALLGFNASLNGDLNLRVFEILAAGGALLTDRLAPEAGLDGLLSDRRDVLLYGSAEELAERAAAALADPAATRAVGAVGARWFDEHLGEERRRAAFRALAFDGTPVAGWELPAGASGSVFFPDRTDLRRQSLVVYERLQELHRIRDQVCVTLASGAPSDFAAMCATLPRVRINGTDELMSDLTVCTGTQSAEALAASTARLWLWDQGVEAEPRVAECLRAAGFSRPDPTVAFYTAVEPEVDVATEEDAAGACAVALRLVGAGRLRAAEVLLAAVLERFPCEFKALVMLAQLRQRAKDYDRALRFYDAAIAANPGHALAFTQRALIQVRRFQGAPPPPRVFDPQRLFVTMSALGQNGRFGKQLLQYGLLRLYGEQVGAQVLVPDWIGRDLFGCSDPLPRAVRPVATLAAEEVVAVVAGDRSDGRTNVDTTGYFCGDTTPWAVHQARFQSYFEPIGKVRELAEAALHRLAERGRTVVALHLRRGDYGYGQFWTAPSAWYRTWLDSVWPMLETPVLYLATDEPTIAAEFVGYNLIVSSDLGMPIPGVEFFLDHWVLRHAHVLAISNSTFSATAALLNRDLRHCVRPDREVGGLRPYRPWGEKVLLE